MKSCIAEPGGEEACVFWLATGEEVLIFLAKLVLWFELENGNQEGKYCTYRIRGYNSTGTATRLSKNIVGFEVALCSEDVLCVGCSTAEC